MASKRRKIFEAFQGRLAVIKQTNGFLTDVGARIFIGEAASLGPDDPDDAILLLPEEDVPSAGQGLGSGTGVAIEIQLTLSIHALAKTGLDEAQIRIEDLIRDIKTAVELTDRSLGGLVGGLRRGPTRQLEREEGATTIGASVEYQMVYSEKWGDPDG